MYLVCGYTEGCYSIEYSVPCIRGVYNLCFFESGVIGGVSVLSVDSQSSAARLAGGGSLSFSRLCSFFQRLQFFGRWKDIATANDRYVDPACRDTYGCYRLYGHLLPAADRLADQARQPSDMVQW